MSTNQRENERNERKLEKKRKRQKIAWIIIILVIIALLVMKLCEIDFSSIGIKGAPSAGAASEQGGFPFELQSGGDSSFGELSDNIYVLNDNSLTVIGRSDAKELLSVQHGYSNPIIETAGSYSVLYDQGAASYMLCSKSEQIYEDKADNIILCADVSDSGSVVICTTSDSAKTSIKLLNKSLNEKFSYDVQDGFVTAVAADSRGSRLAFAVVSSENAAFKTTVYTMNIDDESPRAQFVYYSSVLDLEFKSSDLYVVGADFVSVISSLKNETKVFEQGSASVVSYCFNSSKELVYAYSDYDGSSETKIALVKASGRAEEITSVDSKIKDITASSSHVSVLTSGSVVSYKISNGEETAVYNADDSYTSIQQMSSKIFAKHQTRVELLSENQE